jgi:hypothetical protein
VTIVDVYEPPPPPKPAQVQSPPPAASTPQDDSLHCNPPRSQLEFEQCHATDYDDEPAPAPQHTPTHTHTEDEPMPALPQVGECNNGVDDDGDGATDLGDPGCAGSGDQSE